MLKLHDFAVSLKQKKKTKKYDHQKILVNKKCKRIIYMFQMAANQAYITNTYI